MEGWLSAPLTECIQKIVIPAKVPRKQFQDSARFPIVSQEKDLINGYWSDESAVISVNSPIIVFGDHTQVLKYIDFDFVVGADGVKLLQPKPFLNAKYFYYFLMANPIETLGYARHFRLLKDLDVRFPQSLSEQERIVAILDEAFAAIATTTVNVERNLVNARGVFENKMDRIFSHPDHEWEEKKLEDVCGIVSTLVDPRDPEYIDLAHIGAGNMISNTGQLINVQTAREEGLKSGKYVFDSRMVLYSKIRPYLMKVSRPDFEGLCSADVYPLLPKHSVIERDFLFYLLLSTPFTEYAVNGSARAGMPKVNRDHLFQYCTHFPPCDTQRQITAGLDTLSDECHNLEALYQRKLALLAELKQSLLHQAFTGALGG